MTLSCGRRSKKCRNAKDPIVCELATRLKERKLYKAVDVSALLDHRGGAAATARFKAKLTQAKKEGAFGPFDILEDTATRNPYKRRGSETPESLLKVSDPAQRWNRL